MGFCRNQVTTGVTSFSDGHPFVAILLKHDSTLNCEWAAKLKDLYFCLVAVLEPMQLNIIITFEYHSDIIFMNK